MYGPQLDHTEIDKALESSVIGQPKFGADPLNRVTVTASVAHECPSFPVYSVPNSVSAQPLCFDRKLKKSEEQAYERRMVATEEWAAINLGPFQDQPIGLLIVQSLECWKGQVQPTKDEIARVQRRVIELSYSQKSEESDLIPVGEFTIKYPSGPLYIRSQFETARFLIVVIPQ